MPEGLFIVQSSSELQDCQNFLVLHLGLLPKVQGICKLVFVSDLPYQVMALLQMDIVNRERSEHQSNSDLLTSQNKIRQKCGLAVHTNEDTSKIGDMISKYFDRYDSLGEGTIRVEHELDELLINLIVTMKLATPTNTRLQLISDVLESVKTVFKKKEFAKWFKHNFIGAKVSSCNLLINGYSLVGKLAKNNRQVQQMIYDGYWEVMQHHIEPSGLACIDAMTFVVQNNERILKSVAESQTHVQSIFDVFLRNYNGFNDSHVSCLIRYLHNLVWIGNSGEDGRIDSVQLQRVTKLVHENRAVIPLALANGPLNCNSVAAGAIHPHVL